MTETTAADARRATERLDDAHAEIRRLTTTLADKDAAVTRLKSDLSALAEASQAAQTATSAAQDRVKDLEAQLENKLMEVGDAEDQLLLQMKENKRALNQIQKLKDRCALSTWHSSLVLTLAIVSIRFNDLRPTRRRLH